MSHIKQSAGRRLSAITIDQAVAGASNLLIAVLAARVLGVESFGLFGIVFQVYVLAQGVSRGLVSEPLLVHPVEVRERPGDAVGTGIVLGLGIALVVLVAGLGTRLLDVHLGNGLVVLAACLPLLVLQDLGRYLAFATARPSSALVLDVAWLVLVLGAVAYLIVADHRTLFAFIAAWAGSGAVAGLLVLVRFHGHPVHLTLSWLRETWRFSWRYLTSYMASQGAVLAASLSLKGIAGPRALGGVLGAQLLVRPYATFESASVAHGTAEISRSYTDREAVRAHVRRTTLLTTGAALVNAVVILLLPGFLGRAVLGDTWEAAHALLVPAALSIVFLGLVTGPRVGLLGQRAIGAALAIDLTYFPFVLVMSVAGALIGGGSGYYWAIVITQALFVVPRWLVYLSHAHRLEPSSGRV